MGRKRAPSADERLQAVLTLLAGPRESPGLRRRRPRADRPSGLRAAGARPGPRRAAGRGERAAGRGHCAGPAPDLLTGPGPERGRLRSRGPTVLPRAPAVPARAPTRRTPERTGRGPAGRTRGSGHRRTESRGRGASAGGCSRGAPGRGTRADPAPHAGAGASLREGQGLGPVPEERRPRGGEPPARERGGANSALEAASGPCETASARNHPREAPRGTA